MIVLKSISNFCGTAVVEFRDTDWMLLIAAISRDFDSLRDKHHSANARREFIKTYKHGSTVDLTRLTKGGLAHNQTWISPAYPITTIF